MAWPLRDHSPTTTQSPPHPRGDGHRRRRVHDLDDDGSLAIGLGDLSGAVVWRNDGGRGWEHVGISVHVIEQVGADDAVVLAPPALRLGLLSALPRAIPRLTAHVHSLRLDADRPPVRVHSRAEGRSQPAVPVMGVDVRHGLMAVRVRRVRHLDGHAPARPHSTSTGDGTTGCWTLGVGGRMMGGVPAVTSRTR